MMVALRKQALSGEEPIAVELAKVAGEVTIGQFAPFLIHDAKNILTALLGQVELMALNHRPEKAGERLEKVRVSCENLNRLFEEISAVATLAGRPEKGSLKSAVDSAQGILQRRFRRTNTKLTVVDATNGALTEYPQSVLATIIFQTMMSSLDAIKNSGAEESEMHCELGQAADGSWTIFLSDNAVNSERVVVECSEKVAPRSVAHGGYSELGLSVAKALTDELRGEMELRDDHGKVTFAFQFPKQVMP